MDTMITDKEEPMFSVKNRSNIRQVTPYGEFGPFESKTFYPVSKVYANAKAFFEVKPQFEVFVESLPIPEKVEVVEPQKPKQMIEEKSKQEETEPPKVEETLKEETKPEGEQPATTPIVPVKPKSKRSF